MRPLIIFLMLISTKTFSQSQVDFGKIKADKKFSCTNCPFIDSFYKLDKICNSKNLFEIRLDINYLPFPDFALIVLAYDGSDGQRPDRKAIKNTRVSGVQESDVYLEIMEKAFAQWETENVRSTSEITEGQSCKIGEDCR